MCDDDGHRVVSQRLLHHHAKENGGGVDGAAKELFEGDESQLGIEIRGGEALLFLAGEFEAKELALRFRVIERGASLEQAFFQPSEGQLDERIVGELFDASGRSIDTLGADGWN
ncbi:hypothetical protein MRS60_07765 [Burkholderia pyrrocinia]|nr:hypothetical protein [Burkholderia pyrrocinia]UOB56986.1 hypothetical protein MRS60_07765 [Burkholderia pyrrocinia]